MTRNVAASVRYRLQGTPDTLYETVQVLSSFLLAIVQALSRERSFVRHWLPGGLWP